MLTFEQLDEVEILPGIWIGINWANIQVTVDPDGDIDGMWINGDTSVELSTEDADPVKKHLAKVLKAAIVKEHAERLSEAGAEEAVAVLERERDVAFAFHRGG